MAQAKGGFQFSIEQKQIRALAKAVKQEEDGKQLRKDLVNDIKKSVGPAISAVQSKLAIPRHSAIRSSPPIGSYLASRVKPQVRLSGRTTGVAIKIGKTPRLRGFTFAARRFNRRTWRHRVFGNDVWVTQTSPIPGFFDETLQRNKERYREAVIQSLERTQARIASRIH